MSETDVDTLRRSYEALNEGDVDAALEALDPDAVWRESPELPGGDEFRGREALRGSWGTSWPSGGSFTNRSRTWSSRAIASRC